MSSVLFVCGSPRRGRSASRATAKYLARFLDHDFQFLDLAAVRMSDDPAEADPAFADVLARIQAADAVVWTFGAWTHFVPLDLQLLLEKLFEQGVRFPGKLAAAVMTSVRVHDDQILERVHFVSEQLGFGYVGDVSAVGNPFFGYVDDETVTEQSCRELAARLERALAQGHVPARVHQAVDAACLAPSARGSALVVDGAPAPKDGARTILVLTGNRLSRDPAAASAVEAVRRCSRNHVEVVELERRRVGKCVGCYQCDFRVEGTCAVRDDYEAIKQRMHEVDGIVLVGSCAAGFVERRLKAFLDRTFGLAHRPSLGGKYGFAVATGGGQLEPETARILQGLLGTRGVISLGALAPSSDPAQIGTTLRRMVEDLDRAMEERWAAAPRFGVRQSHSVYQRLARENGHALKADYRFHRSEFPLSVTPAAMGRGILRLAFRSDALKRRLIAFLSRSLERKRQRRLASYLSSGGRLGRGRELAA